MTYNNCVLSEAEGWATALDGVCKAQSRYFIDAINVAIRLAEQATETGHAAEIFVQTRIGEPRSLQSYLSFDAFARKGLTDRLTSVLRRAPPSRVGLSSEAVVEIAPRNCPTIGAAAPMVTSAACGRPSSQPIRRSTRLLFGARASP